MGKKGKRLRASGSTWDLLRVLNRRGDPALSDSEWGLACDASLGRRMPCEALRLYVQGDTDKLKDEFPRPADMDALFVRALADKAFTKLLASGFPNDSRFWESMPTNLESPSGLFSFPAYVAFLKSLDYSNTYLKGLKKQNIEFVTSASVRPDRWHAIASSCLLLLMLPPTPAEVYEFFEKLLQRDLGAEAVASKLRSADAESLRKLSENLASVILSLALLKKPEAGQIARDTLDRVSPLPGSKHMQTYGEQREAIGKDLLSSSPFAPDLWALALNPLGMDSLWTLHFGEYARTLQVDPGIPTRGLAAPVLGSDSFVGLNMKAFAKMAVRPPEGRMKKKSRTESAKKKKRTRTHRRNNNEKRMPKTVRIPDSWLPIESKPKGIADKRFAKLRAKAWELEEFTREELEKSLNMESRQSSRFLTFASQTEYINMAGDKQGQRDTPYVVVK